MNYFERRVRFAGRVGCRVCEKKSFEDALVWHAG